MGHGGPKDSAAGSGKAVLTRRALLELAGLNVRKHGHSMRVPAGTAVVAKGTWRKRESSWTSSAGT